ncbi:MAG: ABC transporter permease [bacterium]|nr:ABC transporter permease [bacterium]
MNRTIITAIQLAYKSLISQKTRSILTIAGLSIGIAIVITIMAAGRGFDRLVMNQLEVFSPDTISIETKVPSSKNSHIGQATGLLITTLNDKDLDDIKKNLNIISAYGIVMGQAVVKYQNESRAILLMGESYNVIDVEKMAFTSGRLYTKEEEESLAQVAVLGSKAKEDLFGDNDPIGKTIHIKGKPFRVLGTLAKRGAVFGMDMDNMVMLPTKTMQKRILGIDYYRQLIAKVKDRKELDNTVKELEEIVRINHDIIDPTKDDFVAQTMQQAVDILGSIVSGITFLLLALVCVSLIVGGVGIMNIMYVSVVERTFEIGLRKSLGATNRDVLWQFLAESILVTLAGGVVGIVLGALLGFIVYLIAIANNFVWVFEIPLSSIFLAVGFSATIGLVFGIYPAKKAAALNPIEALRKD